MSLIIQLYSRALFLPIAILSHLKEAGKQAVRDIYSIQNMLGAPAVRHMYISQQGTNTDLNEELFVRNQHFISSCAAIDLL